MLSENSEFLEAAGGFGNASRKKRLQIGGRLSLWRPGNFADRAAETI